MEDPRSELDVEDQAGDGRSVVVAEAALGRGAGWVVISSVSGVQLGAAPVRPGIRLLRVVLDEPTNGGTLRVQLFEDDGDGRFDATRDPRVTEDGEPQGETLRYVLE